MLHSTVVDPVVSFQASPACKPVSASSRPPRFSMRHFATDTLHMTCRFVRLRPLMRRPDGPRARLSEIPAKTFNYANSIKFPSLAKQSRIHCAFFTRHDGSSCPPRSAPAVTFVLYSESLTTHPSIRTPCVAPLFHVLLGTSRTGFCWPRLKPRDPRHGEMNTPFSSTNHFYLHLIRLLGHSLTAVYNKNNTFP